MKQLKMMINKTCPMTGKKALHSRPDHHVSNIYLLSICATVCVFVLKRLVYYPPDDQTHTQSTNPTKTLPMKH